MNRPIIVATVRSATLLLVTAVAIIAPFALGSILEATLFGPTLG